MYKVNKSLKIKACCGAGNGTCQIVCLKVKRVLKKIGVSANVTPDTVAATRSQAKSLDLIVCNRALLTQFENAIADGASVIPLVNVMDEKEIEEKLTAWLEEKFPA